MPKQGKFSVFYSWHAVGTMIPLADGFAMSSASAWGVLINRAGSGFLNETPTSCSAAVKVVGGAATETGFCESTDGDGTPFAVEGYSVWEGEYRLP